GHRAHRPGAPHRRQQLLLLDRLDAGAGARRHGGHRADDRAAPRRVGPGGGVRRPGGRDPHRRRRGRRGAGTAVRDLRVPRGAGRGGAGDGPARRAPARPRDRRGHRRHAVHGQPALHHRAVLPRRRGLLRRRRQDGEERRRRHRLDHEDVQRAGRPGADVPDDRPVHRLLQLHEPAAGHRDLAGEPPRARPDLRGPAARRLRGGDLLPRLHHPRRRAEVGHLRSHLHPDLRAARRRAPDAPGRLPHRRLAGDHPDAADGLLPVHRHRRPALPQGRRDRLRDLPDDPLRALVLAAAIAAFVWNRLPVGVVALGVMLALWATGVVTLPEALSGFASPTVVLIAALFVVAEGLDAAGLTTWVGQAVVRYAGASRVRLVLLTMAAVAVLSALITPNGAVAALYPLVVVLAVRFAKSPSRLLMPAAFAAHAGALLVLTGSPV